MERSPSHVKCVTRACVQPVLCRCRDTIFHNGNLDGTRSAIAILHTLRATDLADLLHARDRSRPKLPYLRQAFIEIAEASGLAFPPDDGR